MQLGNITLTLMQAAEAMQAVMNAGRTPILWGSPGIGKTTIVEQMISRVVTRHGPRFANVITLDAASMADGTVQGGIPVPNREKGVTEWLPPDYFINQVSQDGRTLIFLDDIGVLQPAALAPLLRMIQFGKVGSFSLPPGTSFALASNRETENAGAQKLTTALNNRLVHLEVVASADEVVRYALQKDWHISVPMFLRFKEEAVSKFDKTAKAFPSPRSWEAMSDLMKQMEARPISENVQLPLICGTVGQTYGVEYDAFRSLYQTLPSTDQVFMSPATAPCPDKFDSRYAIMGALMRKVTEKNVGAFITYVERMSIPFLVAGLKDLKLINEKLTETQEFIDRCSRKDLRTAMF